MGEKHILYLSYDGLTDPLGSSQVLPYILGLEQKGFRFTVFSFEKKERFNLGKQAVEKAIGEKNIVWKPLFYHKNPPILSTLWDVGLLKNAVKNIQKKEKIDIIHCRSYITALVGEYFKKRYNIPFVFDMRAFYPDERNDAGLWRKDHLVFGKVYRYFKRKEKDFLTNADYTVVLTHAGKKIIQKGELTGNSFNGKLSVIPCCADMEHFNYQNVAENTKNEIKQKIGVNENTTIIGYSGSVGTWYMLLEMMHFFKVFLSKKPNSRFVFLSKENPDEIKNAATRADISLDKIYITPVSREDMPKWLSIFDASVFFILPSFSKQASSPTKQGELMGMGIPVICNAGVGDTESIVSEPLGGFIVNQMNEEGYGKAIDQFFSKTFDKEDIRKRGREIYELKDGIEKYNTIYESVLGL